MILLRGDLKAIERIAFEFVEDQAKECVAYCEARFCPHILVPNIDQLQHLFAQKDTDTTPHTNGEVSNGKFSQLY